MQTISEMVKTVTFLLVNDLWNVDAICFFEISFGDALETTDEAAYKTHPQVFLVRLLTSCLLTLACFLRTGMIPAQWTCRLIPISKA